MIRIVSSLILSVLFFTLEMAVVMKLNGYSSLQITNYMYAIPIWACNLLIAYSLIVQITPWLVKMRVIMHDQDNESYE